ncbi:MAG: serine protease [Thermoleophilales bacterium]|nr:serine protease [Thermoleophilales bacterium]
MSRAAQKVNRVALFGCGLLAAMLVVTVLAVPSHAGAGTRATAGSGASASIVNGHDTTIDQWPWQVALTVSRRVAPGTLTSRRFFCGGSVLAPRLVITAGHCVAELNRRQIHRIEIVSGRTRLNSNRGQIARVTGLRMPVNASGKRRYRALMGAADWDVALLTLATPLSAEPIKLAGPDETEAWSPGHIAWTTGWGITRAFADRVPARLQVTRQVLMGTGLCHRSDGVAFQAMRMVCIGGPRGHSSACNGDSGGPLVVETSAGYRLVGLTSYGDGACRGFVPSVDTKVSGRPIRDWVATSAMNLTGRDVIGSGGVGEPAKEWCRVPAVFGLKTRQAKQRLQASGCRLGRVRTDPWGAGRSGRVIGYSRLPGWLAPPGFKVNVWISP